VAALLLLVAVSGLAGSMLAANDLARTNEESLLADAAARRVADELERVPFSEVWASYNADPADDPGVAGSAPGPDFAVEGLRASPEDPDGAVGRILFPESAGALREDLDLPRLGLPRDLNGDGEIDGDDRGGDYRLLPVTVRVEWRGVSGDNVHEIDLLLVR